MQDIAKAFVVGVVGIGMVTALVFNGRQTAGVLTAGFNGASGLLGTAVSGHYTAA